MIEKAVLDGAEDLNTRLKSLQRAGDLRPFWNIAKTIVFKHTAKHFRQRQGPKGKWAPLSVWTPQLRKSGGDSPLQDEGLLLKSVTTSEAVVRETSTEIVFGTNLDYGLYQQLGMSQTVTPRMRGFFLAKEAWELANAGQIKVPPRPFLYVDKEMKDEIGKGLNFYFQGLIKPGGLKFASK